MQLHELHRYANKRRKRVGRGGKRGTTAGRGTKGQHSRAGRRIRPAARDLLIRIPKLRGFRNKPTGQKPLTLTLAQVVRDLVPLGVGGAMVKVTVDLLRARGLVPRRYRGPVKILDHGALSARLTLDKGITVSKGVKRKIEAAGGSVGK